MIEDSLKRIADELEGIRGILSEYMKKPFNALPVVEIPTFTQTQEAPRRGRPPKEKAPEVEVLEDLVEESKPKATKKDAADAVTSYVAKHDRPKALALLRTLKPGVVHLDNFDGEDMWDKIVEVCRA